MTERIIDPTVGIKDEPNEGSQSDMLEVERYANALVRFIQETQTPMTIGIQGEWGSGKTSLLNFIKETLESKGNVKQIWVNSWEHSLMRSPEETLLQIVGEIIGQMASADKKLKHAETVKSAASGIFKGAVRVAGAAALGAAVNQPLHDLLQGKKNTIKRLRDELQNLAEEIKERKENDFERIVVYIDDLDRMEPPEAVRVLELLKNIFNIKHCVFLLAIDYHVVIKGLKEKFGEEKPENEYEFRAFFDKIIQLPFKMPVYNIGRYVTGLLKQIEFSSDRETGLDNDDVKKVLNWTIGANPRSIKRLVNTLSLISLCQHPDGDADSSSRENENSDEDESNKLVLFTVACLQVAYPKVYDLLQKEPNFTEWSDDLALETTQRKEVSTEGWLEENLEKLKMTELFDEPWEQCLYRVCFLDPRTRNRVSEISTLLNFIKKESEDGDVIQALRWTEVTSVVATDAPQPPKPKVWKSEEDKTQTTKLWNQILDALDDTERFKKGGRGTVSNVIRVSSGKNDKVTFCMNLSDPALLLFTNSQGTTKDNDKIYKTLEGKKAEIEAELGQELTWKNNPKSRRKSIKLRPEPLCSRVKEEVKKLDDGRSTPPDDLWPEVVSFFQENAAKFEKVMLNYLPRTNKKRK